MPDWSNPYVRAYLALAILFAVLAGLSVAARFYAARLRGREWASDDWMCLAALAFYWIQVAVQLWGLWKGGVCEHIENTTLEQQAILDKELLTVQYPYAMVLLLTRVSVCVLLLRIFVQQWIKRAVYFAIFFTSAWWLFVVLDGFLICRPFKCNWDLNDPNCVCGQRPASYIANGVWGILCDLLIWSLPHFTVWKLNTTKLRKLAVTLVFLLGFIDILVSMVRLASLVVWDLQGDATYSLGAVEILSYIETGVAIVVACLIMCRPILDRAVPRRLLSGGKLGYKLKTKLKKSSDDEANHHHWPQSSYLARVEASHRSGANGAEMHRQDSACPDIMVTQDISITREITATTDLERSR